MRKLLVAALGVFVLSAGGLVTLSGPARAVQVPQDRIVSDDPANFTPNVLDGDVRAIAQIGNQIILGGNFTQVQAAGSATPVARQNMVSFDATTGAISTTFVPNPDGEVDAIVPAGGGNIFVGGYFNNVNGSGSPTLAKINATTGAQVTAFKVPKFDGRIKDLRLVGNRLFMGGYFTTVAGNAQAALATVNATTGAFDPFVGQTIAGVHNGGVTTVMKMDVNPAGTRLVAIGNFDTVNAVKNHQIFMLDISGASATAANWQTNFYTSACSSSFQSYMRDLDISPDGSYFVVSTTGAYGGSSGACDETSRWDFAKTGTGLTPSWTDYTGGDTTYAVAITGSVVYTGGHARWQNNALAGDQPGPGAVPRPGIAALDPVNGLPLSWNPTRDRGVGVYDLLATSTGLWVGSDTEHIGQNYELRERIAYFPLTGGKVIPATNPPGLPNDVYSASTTGNTLSRRQFDGSTAGTAQTVDPGGLAWSTVRGSFMLNGQLYTGWSDGSFTRRTFNGSTYGAATPVNTHDQLTTLTSWHTDLASVTGMFFLNGRVYYTKSGSSSLFYRYFTAENDVVGVLPITASTTATGPNFSTVAGMFTAGDKLYYGSTADGNLRRVDLVDGKPSGAATVVSGPAAGGVTWNARSMFLYQSASGNNAGNQAPTAAFSSSCSGLTCSFDASGSADEDGTIASYAWTFGDGQTGTGVSPEHQYAAGGSSSVTLTVTDDDGATNTVTHSVAPVVSAVQYVASATANSNAVSQSVTVPASVQAGDTLLLFFANNDDTVTPGTPSGGSWTSTGTVSPAGMLGRGWSATAGAGTAGSTITVTSSAISKAALTLAVYRGAAAAQPVAASAASSETVARTTHTTPTVTGPGGWVVSFWADKTSTATAITPDSSATGRAASSGTGSGRITSVLADSAGAAAAGSAGGVPATSDASSAKAVMFTVELGS